MAIELPSEPGKPPRHVPLLGTFLGIFIAYGLLRVMLNALIGFDFAWEINAINSWMVVIIGLIVGGSIGGVIQLRHQGRAADIPSFLRRVLLGGLDLFLIWVPMFLAYWLGERLAGGVGALVGLVGSAVLIFLVQRRFFHRPLSEKPSAPPPA
jgi:hypothetical protein